MRDCTAARWYGEATRPINSTAWINAETWEKGNRRQTRAADHGGITFKEKHDLLLSTRRSAICLRSKLYTSLTVTNETERRQTEFVLYWRARFTVPQ